MTMTWWLWLILGVLLAGMTAFFAFLSLSAGSAYGANYHSLSSRQRVMGRLLYLGSLITSLLCAAGGTVAVLLAIKRFIA
jgi:ABC-type spermidine/putrescine transport system permease subunit I